MWKDADEGEGSEGEGEGGELSLCYIYIAMMVQQTVCLSNARAVRCPC